MKIAQHFRAFLERYHYLQLPQIGRFEVVGENPAAPDNGVLRKWIAFSADKNQLQDSELVDFISKNMRIETCITESDLKSFISSIKELLIQGFEVEIPGIGYLHFEPNNILKFSGKNIYKKTIQKRWKRTSAALSHSFWF
jgi:nucleoid DNA-binding protein